VIVLVAMVVVMVATSAAGTMLVMSMLMLMFVAVMIVGVPVIMMVMTMVMMVVVVAMVGALFRPEGALHRGRDAALPAGELGQGWGVLHIEGICRDLRKAVLAAEMPGEAHKAQGILGPHLQKVLGCGLHLYETAVLEPQGVPVVDHRLHVEVEMDLGAGLGLQMRMAAAAGRVIQDDRVDNPVGLHGRLADEGGGARHGNSRKALIGNR